MKKYFLIKKNNTYYGKKCVFFTNNSNKDDFEIALIIEEIGYKSKQNALKGTKTLEKYFKRLDINYKKEDLEVVEITLIR